MSVVMKSVQLKANTLCIWNALTSSSELSKWWNDGTILEPRIDGIFHEPWQDANGNNQLATGIVLEVIPFKKITFTWKERFWTDEKKTKCSFIIEEQKCVRLLTVVHSGWDCFPCEKADILSRGFEAGWAYLLDRLKSHIDSVELKESAK